MGVKGYPYAIGSYSQRHTLYSDDKGVYHLPLLPLFVHPLYVFLLLFATFLSVIFRLSLFLLMFPFVSVCLSMYLICLSVHFFSSLISFCLFNEVIASNASH